MSLIMGADLAGMAAANAALLAPELVAIEGGTFTMGSGVFEEAPEHEVTVSSFQMSQNPITNEQYGRLVNSLRDQRFALIGADPQTGVEKLLALGSSTTEAQSALSKMPMTELFPSAGDVAVGGASRLVSSLTIAHIPDHDTSFKRSRQPAVDVSWHDAFVWAALHAALLPSEARTEYASRVVRGERRLRDYATPSGRLTKEEVCYDADEPADVDDPRYPTLENGVRHLTGLVWEWQRDWYGPYPERRMVDPTGPASGETKVLRGGSWLSVNAGSVRAAYRLNSLPGHRYDYFGFRVVVPEDSKG